MKKYTSTLVMKAAITTQSGSPEVIQIREMPKPEVMSGWILIQVKAFGLNRSELFTRRGDSPGVTFPRIQGIECVGLVENDPSGTFQKGDQVAAMMGGMGRSFDGGYAEYTLVPKEIVLPFKSNLPWHILGAIPEMFQTVNGSLNQALEIESGEVLLVRGGTSSIGLLAAQLAKRQGLTVVSTTRNNDKKQTLLDNGADYAIVDSGNISGKIMEMFPNGVDKVLELIGTKTLKDSLKCIAQKGMVCMTGILGNEWTLSGFTPMEDIPSLGRLTIYSGEAKNLPPALLQEFIDEVEKENVILNIDKVFLLTQIVEAHQYLESNSAKGKVVVEL